MAKKLEEPVDANGGCEAVSRLRETYTAIIVGQAVIRERKSEETIGGSLAEIASISPLKCLPLGLKQIVHKHNPDLVTLAEEVPPAVPLV